VVENVEKQRNDEYPEAEEINIEIMGLDEWNKAQLRSIEIYVKNYLQMELVESGWETSVPASVILRVYDPFLTDSVKMRVKTAKPSGTVQITRRTKVNIEGVPAAPHGLSLGPPIGSKK
jgi:hypothetical protein